ncbi:unnamed protein product [Hydatigera taeniaeformis]|uniref:DUF5727 domain-containing protein n=1 Tax=Hydatigena taeniaeformis TaxID=6205 RepID=A0A0R3XDJ7_HYDTA|nr:unnamed protein product [Hydatigera taeniaeformis]
MIVEPQPDVRYYSGRLCTIPLAADTGTSMEVKASPHASLALVCKSENGQNMYTGASHISLPPILKTISIDMLHVKFTKQMWVVYYDPTTSRQVDVCATVATEAHIWFRDEDVQASDTQMATTRNGVSNPSSQAAT